MMENLTRIISEFCETDMHQKLKDCQGLRTQAYQGSGRYMEGDLVRFQYLNNNAWLGPAAVLCHRGQSVWLHAHSDVKMVASCRVKPYQLIDRNAVKDESPEDAE